jgi:hypothetical protein
MCLAALGTGSWRCPTATPHGRHHLTTGVRVPARRQSPGTAFVRVRSAGRTQSSCEIGAIGSSWLGCRDFRPSATDLQWQCRAQTGLQPGQDRAYAIPHRCVVSHPDYGLAPPRGHAKGGAARVEGVYSVGSGCRRRGTRREGGDVRVSAPGLASWRSRSVNASMISGASNARLRRPIVIWRKIPTSTSR